MATNVLDKVPTKNKGAKTRAVALRLDVYEALSKECKRRKISLKQTVEYLIKDALGGKGA